MIWPFIPLDEMIEGIEFKTDVIRPYSAEQRIGLLERPRRRFNHDYLLSPEAYERARAMIRGHQPADFDIPDWTNVQQVSVSAGASSISFDNTYPTLTDADRVMLWQSDSVYEELDVSAGDSSGLTLGTNVAGKYPSGLLVPLLSCYSTEGLSVTRSAKLTRPGQAEWVHYVAADVANDSLFSTYRGDLLTTQYVQIGSDSRPEVTSRDFETVDNGLGLPFFDTKTSEADQTFLMAWQPETRQEQWELRQKLYALRGRKRAFWLPDWNSGMALAANAGNGATTISVRDFGFTAGYVTGDLFVLLTNGTVITRQITEAVDAGATETLTLASGLPQAVATTDVAVMCLLHRVRLAQDRIDLVHRTGTGPKIVVSAQQVPLT